MTPCVSPLRGCADPVDPAGSAGSEKKINNLAALFCKVDSSPALVVGSPWRHFYFKDCLKCFGDNYPCASVNDACSEHSW